MSIKRVSISAFLVLGLIFASCEHKRKHEEKNSAKTEKHHDKEQNKHSEETAMVTYACLMRCEGDKTYHKPGNCPDCKMELKRVEDHAHDGQEHNHDHSHEDH